MRGDRGGLKGPTSALAALVCMLLAPHVAPAHAASAHTTAAHAKPAHAEPVLASAGHRADIRAATLASSADAAALTLDLDRTTNYRLFTLGHPGRIVLDLGEARFAPGAHLPHAGGIVQELRAGSRPHGGLRIVLQLDSSATSRGDVRLPVHVYWRRGRTRGTSRLTVTVGGSLPKAARVAASAHSANPRPVSRAATFRAPHAPASTDRDVVIAVDAGHGGQDPGAIGRHGTEEKNVTLAIARALAKRIDAEPGMRAVLTRDSDVFLPLRERMRRAREAHANLFVSVHADSIHDPTVSGASVYVLSERGATDEAARWLAERENAADALGGVPLADKSSSLASVLLDVVQTASISASMTAAERVLTALDRVGEVRKARVQQAGFVVLKSPDIPSMLVETAYISNPRDEQRLRTAREQRKLADAIFSGLLGYFEAHPPSRTRFARMLKRDSSAVVAGAPGAPGVPGVPGVAGSPGSEPGGI